MQDADNLGLVTHLRPRSGLDDWTDRNAQKGELPVLPEPYVEPLSRTQFVLVWAALILVSIGIWVALFKIAKALL